MIEGLLQGLAGLLDKFKAKNPLIYAIGVSVLMIALFAINTLAENGVFTMSEGFAKAVEYLAMLVLALTGSRTVKYLPENKNPSAQAKFNPDYND